MIGALTELEQPNYTRCGTSREHNSSSSRIDRTYTSIPPWLLKEFRISTHLITNPQQTLFYKLSDHGSVGTHLTTRPLLPTHLQPIPSWLTSHPISASTLDQIETKMQLDAEGDPIKRWRNHKAAIRIASRLAMKRILSKQAVTAPEKKGPTLGDRSKGTYQM